MMDAPSDRPQISIVTPSLNQASTIAAALDSVLSQAGPPVEYMVIDGGSTDGTREVIQRYADRLAYWVSEPDRGQSHALNKGFARARGDIVGWLNADDLLVPGALARVREVFAVGDCDAVCGACRYEYADGTGRVMGVTPQGLMMLPVYDPIQQPSCFWQRSLHERVAGLDERLAYGMDWDLWLRFRRAGARFKAIPDVLSVYRMTGTNKTCVGGETRNREMYELLRRHRGDGSVVLTEMAYRVLWPLKRLRQRQPEWLCRPISNATRTTLLMALGPLFGFDRVRCCTHPFS